MQKYLLFFLFGFVLFACEDSLALKQKKLQDAQWEAMMANHDVVMPMMGTTYKVRKNLKTFLEKNENLPNEISTQANVLIQTLVDADSGMMDWMNKNGGQKLEKIQDKMEHKAILEYIKEQDESIKSVGKKMTNNIKKGIDFLELNKLKQE